MRTLFFVPPPHNQNERARDLKHDGIRVGEIIAYRAWRVIEPSWMHKSDNLLHSVFMKDYVWHPGRPASGDVRRHGIYSLRNVIRSRQDYGYPNAGGPLLLGSVKIWGEIVEHEAGYRSEFARIISLDYGDPDLLERFRWIYDVNITPTDIWLDK